MNILIWHREAKLKKRSKYLPVQPSWNITETLSCIKKSTRLNATTCEHCTTQSLIYKNIYMVLDFPGQLMICNSICAKKKTNYLKFKKYYHPNIQI